MAAPVTDEAAIRHLLDSLAAEPRTGSETPAEREIPSWRIRRVDGGRNNLLYRATGPAGDVVVKFAREDGRDRAGHEYQALTALRRAGLDLAPRPLLLDRVAYRWPVVVQSWLPGEVGSMPRTDDEWDGIVGHLVRFTA